MNVISATSDIHILESIAFKESSKQTAGVEVGFVATSQPLQVERYESAPVIRSPDLLPVCFLILWAIAIFVFLRFTPHRSKQTVCTVRGQIPCTNCRFFTNNPYLKCAVRPSTALTKQAIDCSDYQA